MMMIKKEIEKKKLLILDNIKDGDVINLQGKSKLWPLKKIPLAIGYWRIRAHQKKILYHKQLRPQAFFMDTHTTQSFGNKIFSVEPPRAKYWDAEEYIENCLKNDERITVLRYNIPLKEGRLLCDIPEYIEKMKYSADMLIGTKYDFLQLCGIALNRILGYDWNYKIKFLDAGKKLRVCSTGIRTNFEYLRKRIEPEMKRLFNKLERSFWTGKEYGKFKKIDVEMTTPAFFSNSKYFSSEFKEIERV